MQVLPSIRSSAQQVPLHAGRRDGTHAPVTPFDRLTETKARNPHQHARTTLGNEPRWTYRPRVFMWVFYAEMHKSRGIGGISVHCGQEVSGYRWTISGDEPSIVMFICLRQWTRCRIASYRILLLNLLTGLVYNLAYHWSVRQSDSPQVSTCCWWVIHGPNQMQARDLFHICTWSLVWEVVQQD